MSLTQVIKEQAQAIGFQLVGVTTPDPPEHFAVYEDWLAKGRHGEMGYLASESACQRRSDPRRILPECRSILVLGMRYPAPTLTPYPSPFHGEGKFSDKGSASPTLYHQDLLPPLRFGEGEKRGEVVGRLASYAWGDDYHDVLAEGLRRLVEFIEAQVGHPVPNRWYTDTGPILERDLAQRAGLGWIGKNTCLIHPRLGSYFLLAEVLLGIELEPDPPFLPDHCGTCTRCIDACPTACILPDRTLDARRCISYLTIELKGAIPLELRPQMGDWVFGCDVCQQVCPWNVRFGSPQGDPAFAPRPGVPAPELVAELSLSPQAFNAKFKDSPVKRTKRRGYLRNVAVALGNRGSEASVPALAQSLLEDPESRVRGHAAWALGQIGGEAARQALEAALVTEQDQAVLGEIRSAIQPQ